MKEDDMGWRARLCSGLMVLASLGGCDYVAQKELKPGVSTVDDVRRMMGKPEMIWEEEDGSQVLEYVRGPAGTETYMVELDAEGRYLGMKNVLVQENFDRVRPGMSRDDLRRLLGKPTEIERIALKRQEVWSWRFSSEYNRPDMFNVHFDPEGKVVTTSVTAAKDGPEPGR